MSRVPGTSLRLFVWSRPRERPGGGGAAPGGRPPCGGPRARSAAPAGGVGGEAEVGPRGVGLARVLAMPEVAPLYVVMLSDA